MVVQHNMQASNANRLLNITTGQQAKSTEKLSSGFKINRAADDAAGLSISEKMRKQIKGLDRASTNAEDGVSAVQTAEGALTEVHSMLQRMNELAVQASNGTNSVSDRESIQEEIKALTTEIDRVAETTKFNETYLLKGSSGTKSVILKGHDAGLKGVFVDGTTRATMKMNIKIGTSVSIGGKNYNIIKDAKTDDTDRVAALQKAISSLGTESNNGKTVTLDGTKYTMQVEKYTDANGNQKAECKFVTGTGTEYSSAEVGAMVKDGTKVQLESGTAIGKLGKTSNGTVIVARDDTLATNITQGKAVSLIATALLQANNIGVGNDSLDKRAVGFGTVAKFVTLEGKVGSKKIADTVTKVGTAVTFTIQKGTIRVEKDLNFALHVGADADLTNKINVNLETMSSANLGVKDLNVKDDSGIAATYAIDAIADAVAKVSAQRSALGAVQNRLEHTIANLDNVVENTESAESRIRDTDMAEEMVTFSKNNILAQAGQSMLAQANQSNQGVLSLLG